MIFHIIALIIFGHISHIDLGESVSASEHEAFVAAVLEEEEEQRKLGMTNITIYSISM